MRKSSRRAPASDATPESGRSRSPAPSMARWNVSATSRRRRPEPAAVELGLAQDVEPERRVPEERVALRLRQRVELGAAVAVLICALVSVVTATPLLRRNLAIC